MIVIYIQHVCPSRKEINLKFSPVLLQDASEEQTECGILGADSSCLRNQRRAWLRAGWAWLLLSLLPSNNEGQSPGRSQNLDQRLQDEKSSS